MGLSGRFSIAAKLAVGSLVLLALMLASSGWAFLSMRAVQAGYGTLLDKTYPTALSAKNLEAQVLGMAQSVMAFAATRDTRQVKILKDAEENGNQLLTSLQEATAGDEQAKAMVADVFITLPMAARYGWVHAGLVLVAVVISVPIWSYFGWTP